MLEIDYLATVTDGLIDFTRNSEHLKDIAVLGGDQVFFIIEPVLFYYLLETAADIWISSNHLMIDASILFFEEYINFGLIFSLIGALYCCEHLSWHGLCCYGEQDCEGKYGRCALSGSSEHYYYIYFTLI